MGNYKFRLADMMPNAWFYKLRDMSNKKPRTAHKFTTSTVVTTHSLDHQKTNIKKTKKSKSKSKNKTNPTFPNSSSSSASSPSTTATTTVSFKPSLPSYSHSPRKSYYFTRDCPNSPKPQHQTSPIQQQQHQTLVESPRRSSSRNKARRRRSSSSSKQQLSVRCDRNSLSSEYSPEKEYSDERKFRCDGVLPTDTSKTCSCRGQDDKTKNEESDNDSFSRVELPPIVTRAKKEKKQQYHSVNSLALRSTVTTSHHHHTTGTNSPGFRVRINNSPRIANKRFSGFRKSVSSSSSSGNSRSSKSLTDSFAVVKTSFDPQRDFRESMVEMIVENNIRDSKDLEDLLACYLSLNSDEYHAVIIKVFKQIWFDLTDIK